MISSREIRWPWVLLIGALLGYAILITYNVTITVGASGAVLPNPLRNDIRSLLQFALIAAIIWMTKSSSDGYASGYQDGLRAAAGVVQLPVRSRA